jgi:hypothetical protein
MTLKRWVWIARLRGDSRAWAATLPDTGGIGCTTDPFSAIYDETVEGLKAKLGHQFRDFVPSHFRMTYRLGDKEARWPE